MSFNFPPPPTDGVENGMKLKSQSTPSSTMTHLDQLVWRLMERKLTRYFMTKLVTR